MNARLYDPVLGRMISPDNFVNGAFASQAYNRYSYANNNPLKYTDPDGNHPILVAMAISAVINIAMQVVQNGGFDNFSFESLLFSVVQGGISAGMAGTIGDGLMASKLTGFTKLAAGIALHALSGGLQAAVFGGNVWQGAISGAVGHLVGEELNRGASKLLGRATDDLGLLGYFVTGGGTSAAVAYATGGDPMQAFIIGGATAAFNSFLHQGGDEGYSQSSPQDLMAEDPLIVTKMTFALFDLVGEGVKVAGEGVSLGIKWSIKKWSFWRLSRGGFKSFEEFKKLYGAAGPGNAWHHIVEQHASNIAKFGNEAIHNPKNLVVLDNRAGQIHRKITGYYNSIQPFTNGARVRDWIKVQSYEEQYNFGIKVMKQFGWKP